jgi:hypothetical protein
MGRDLRCEALSAPTDLEHRAATVCRTAGQDCRQPQAGAEPSGGREGSQVVAQAIHTRRAPVVAAVVRTFAILLVGLALGVGVALASPSHLYTALLTTAYPDSQLPSGFFSAKVSLQNPGSTGRSHHVVGEVAVAINGDDPEDAILYGVFPNGHDARADLANAKPSGNAHRVGNVPGYRLPSSWLTGSITGKNAFGKTVTNGLTGMIVVEGSVLVMSVTGSADSTDSGNVPAALALLKSGIRHLQRIEARLGGR